ncbi:MAG: riboflavin biosynthesis protein RibF [Lachnospiraceae bacterium]|nr:riboflavin biosynthesis protein RibF [Lachnospiraceae bacterium]
MEKVWDDLRFFPDRIIRKSAVLTIGNFDGLHKGHMTLLRKTDLMAKSMENEGKQPEVIRVMLTFSPHPQELISGSGKGFERLFSDEEKLDMAEESGLLDEVILLNFTPEVMHMEPEAFFREILIERYRACGIVVGENFRFGDRGRGTAGFLKEMCLRENIPCCVIPDVYDVQDDPREGKCISSTRIKELLTEGDVRRAADLLGRPYFIRGEVQEGKHVGTEMDTPTLNIFPAPGQMLPRWGVYVSRTHIGEESYRSITNVGGNPTFGGEDPRSETFVFDFSGCLYGKTVRVELLEFIRPEQHFDSVDALKQQLTKDINTASAYFPAESGD